MRLGRRNSTFWRVAVLAMISASGTACSSLPTVPDWVDPTTWFDDDTANAPDNAQTPDLASVPNKPAASTPDDQHEVAESLAADRANAKYSADALRAGTEAAAAPPPTLAATPSKDESGEAATAAATSHKPARAASAPAPVQVASVDRSVASEPTGSAMPGTLPSTPAGVGYATTPAPEPVQTASLPDAAPAAAPAATPTVAASSEPAATPTVAASSEPEATPARVAKPRRTHRTAVASAEPVEAVGSPPIGAQPALPPVTPAPQQVASVSPSDAALGFKPSTAPPLDPTISQFVAAPIVDHYRQTAANAGMYSSGVPVTRLASASNSRLRRPARSSVAEGGPEHMTGAVVANLEALTPTSAPVASTSAYANTQGLPPTTVVFFPGDAVRLSAEGKAQVQAAVEQYRANGGQGYIRVVGHSSSRTANMTAEKHMEIIFRKSQERADAVAQEIIREGVAANKVLVEAVGDTQPVYYESMPKGEDGNRRAEIFLQS